MPQTGLFAGLVVQDLAEVDGGLLISQRAVEGRGPPGRRRDQRAVAGGSPLPGCAHQGPAYAAAAILAADEDFPGPGHRPVGVEGQMPRAHQVAQALVPVHRQGQAGSIPGGQGRVTAAGPGPGERERLRQPGGQAGDRRGVAGTGGPGLAPRIAHRPMIADGRPGGARLDNGLVIDVDPGRFEDMVITALDGLPEELGRLMRNVAVTVEHGPGPPGLLGLYQGIPLTSRTSDYAGVLPDQITIYRREICAICRTEQEVAGQVRRTVIHEIAHHFGIDDRRLSELGW